MASSVERSEREVIAAFEDALRAAGVGVPRGGVIPDGEFHRFEGEGDKRGRKNAYYVLHVDGKPSGAFGTNKGDARHTWTLEGVAPLTPEQRRELAERARGRAAEKVARVAREQAAAAALADRMWGAATTALEHPYLAAKGVSAHDVRVGAWIKEWPDKATGEIKSKSFPGALMIRMRDGANKTWGLQAIYAKPITWGGEERGKDFIFGSRKQGVWHSIGKPLEIAGRMTVLIGEGYSTCATVHEATDCGILVAFDAGNLEAVAREVRRMKPDWRIVIVADNDAWTVNARKEPWNPGVEKATAAARAVDGEVVVPWMNADALGAHPKGEPTDFNDLASHGGGLAEVRRQVMAVLDPPPAPRAAPQEEEPPPLEAYDGPNDGFTPEPFIPSDEDVGGDHDTRGYFTIRGYDKERLYVYSHERKLVMARGLSDWGPSALITISPISWWESEFPGNKGMNATAAHNWMVREATKAGYFDPDSLRGRGAWRDDGRLVYHFGNRLSVDGRMMDVARFEDTTFIYEQGKAMRALATEAASKVEGKRILDTAKMFSWSRPASAVLLAGWCALAPFSGALMWRPHIWLTGGAGSGKSTVLSLFVDWLMNGSCLFANGNSTEAGIRQYLGQDAIPILFDESEQNNVNERLRIQAVLALLRQASSESGARTFKGTQSGSSMNFNIRSMACLSSIQVGLEQQADMERITLLGLKSKREATDAAGDWKALSGALAALRADPTLPARLMRRTLENLPMILQAVSVFAEAAAERFGSQREGDQYGTMLAGAWSLIRDHVPTVEEARQLIDAYDWADYTADSETEASEKALAALLGARLRLKGGDEVTVYEAVCWAAEHADGDEEPGDADGGRSARMGRKDANKLLKRWGMAVKVDDAAGGLWRGGEYQPQNARLLVANQSEELRSLMAKTPFAADLKGQLGRIDGAEAHEAYKFLGNTSRAVSLPITDVLGIEAPKAARVMPLDDDEVPF